MQILRSRCNEKSTRKPIAKSAHLCYNVAYLFPFLYQTVLYLSLEVNVKGKRIFYSELSYVLGIVVLALGTAFMERADFGLSMIVAPAYLIHMKVSEFLPFYSFGMSGYVLQALLLVLLSVVMRKVKKNYFLSLLTAVIYGFVLDGLIALVAFIPFTGTVARIVFYILGLVTCPLGVALLFRTYFPPEAYDLIVKEFSVKFNIPIGKIKTAYDLLSCFVAIVLSLCFFGGFVGIHWGTVVCAFFNGWLLARWGRVLDHFFVFQDVFPLREKL